PELRLDMAEGEPFALMAQLSAQAVFGAEARVITLDGLRVEFPHGWGLVRASNTTPSLVLRFEADNAAALADIQARFRQPLHALRPDLALPF
ncbi:MAG TPA: phosphomannomutase/phosphoglucomutase, partial [Candidatus Competibacteraceae bacterium]|nr:phosphomannomutase/phosphoglucomutase [Candidatus Competibacteraceae bacterium]